MTDQLAFDLPAHVRLGAEDFFVSAANETAYAMLHAPATWPDHKLALVGPAGSGKTHLARVFAASAGAVILNAADIRADTPLPTTPFVLEDGDALPTQAEEWVFHAHNAAARESRPFLITAQTSPARWRIALPDLLSRLSATTTVIIQDPDDPLLTAVLLKHFADRQLAPAPDAISYLIKHLPRSFAAARDIVHHLDKNALAQGKPLTRPFVREILDSLGDLAQ